MARTEDNRGYLLESECLAALLQCCGTGYTGDQQYYALGALSFLIKESSVGAPGATESRRTGLQLFAEKVLREASVPWHTCAPGDTKDTHGGAIGFLVGWSTFAATDGGGTGVVVLARLLGDGLGDRAQHGRL